MNTDPTQTLYLTNLSSQVNTPELKASLYGLFSTYGIILAINASATAKMREQAFIAFDNVASATAALRSLNGYTFYDRPMKIAYATTKSDAVAKLDGTYRPKIVDRKASSTNRTVLGKREADDAQDGKSVATEDDEDDSE
ncbi:hypothetical protein BDF14DRAFT_1853242 [Spinellus fusiger]|nr:hypothetical protein BDF14DRAFT_1853242 [Spinellus fusiger]